MAVADDEFSAQLQDMMHESVTLLHVTGRDRYGTPTYTALVPDVLAHVEDRQRIVRSATGEEVTSSTTLYLGSTVADVTPDDHVLVEGVERHIVSVAQDTMAVGSAPTRVYLL
jgi:hypothetical protein